MERIMDIVQSILTYICTGGLACLVGFLIRETKRITVLEEQDKMHTQNMERITDLTEKVVRMDVKLDLILDGRIKGGE